MSHIATKAARPDHFRDRAQRSLAAILALTVVGQTSIEPKFSPQFEFDKPPSEDSNSDVLGPARPYGVSGQRCPWATPEEKIILLERQDGLRWCR